MRRGKNTPLYRTTPFALGFLAALTLAAFLWLLTGEDWDRVSFVDFVPAAGSFIASFLSLFIAYFVFSEQVKTRQAATDPVILVHLGTREDAPSLIMLNISNVGAGAALNVKVSFNKETAKDWKVRGETAIDLSEIAKEIRAIPQDGRVSFPLNTYQGMFKEPPLDSLEARVVFEDVDGGVHSSVHYVNINELVGQSANKTPIAQISDSLSKIERALARLADRNHEFFVIMETLEENRQREAAQRKAFLDQMQANKEAQG